MLLVGHMNFRYRWVRGSIATKDKQSFQKSNVMENIKLTTSKCFPLQRRLCLSGCTFINWRIFSFSLLIVMFALYGKSNDSPFNRVTVIDPAVADETSSASTEVLTTGNILSKAYWHFLKFEDDSGTGSSHWEHFLCLSQYDVKHYKGNQVQSIIRWNIMKWNCKLKTVQTNKSKQSM